MKLQMQGFYRLQAWSELIKRYAAVFRAAWQQRVQLDGVVMQRHESDFLPAALALQETPVSPAPRVTMWSLMVFAVLMLGWAVFGHVDVVAVATGKVIPDERSKVIQPLDSGVVRRIAVSDGQAVKAGDVLVELDSSLAAADGQRVRNELLQAVLDSARARSMLASVERGSQPVWQSFLKELSTNHDDTAFFAYGSDSGLGKPDRAHIPDEAEHPSVALAFQLLLTEWSEYRSRLSRLDAERGRREAERESLTRNVLRLERSLPLTRQRAEDYQRLRADNFVSAHAYLEKEQARIEQEGELLTSRGRLAEVGAALTELQMQRQALIAETRRLHTDRLQEGQRKRAVLEQEQDKSRSRLGWTVLKAPVDGRVQQLSISTVGGVVTPAQVLMVLVPDETPLMVEAILENRDIGFVRQGQPAEIKLETFPFTRFGTVPSVVRSVSADAIADERRGLVFAVRAALLRQTVNVDGQVVSIVPGMAVSVEIMTGRRRVIDYFLSPLIQKASESLRER